MNPVQYNVLGGARVMVGEVDKAAGRVGEGLAREACRGIFRTVY